MNMEEIDRLTRKKLGNYEPERTLHKMRSRMINLIVQEKEVEEALHPFQGFAGELLEAMMKGADMSIVKLGQPQERRKKMLTKVVMIKVLNSKGSIVGGHELTEITFNKDGSMSVLPSRVFKEGMTEVKKGGAIFIEEVWST